MEANRLPVLFGRAGAAARAQRGELAPEREFARSVREVRRQARLVDEKACMRVRVIEDVALEAMGAGTHVASQAVRLAETCPVAEPMLRLIVEQTGLELGRVVSDAARDLRW